MTENNIFTQYMQKRNVIVKNKKILQSSYTPENLPHRMDKIKEIVEIIAPALNKDKPSNILIFGKTGTGKTAVMNFVGKELKKADEIIITSTGVPCIRALSLDGEAIGGRDPGLLDKLQKAYMDFFISETDRTQVLDEMHY